MPPESRNRSRWGADPSHTAKPENQRLHETEHGLMWVRSFGIAFALMQIYTDVRAAGSSAPPSYLKPSAYGLVALFAAFNLALVVWLSRRHSSGAMRATGLVALVADHLFLVGLVWLYSYRSDTAMWALLFVLPLEAALRYEVPGAFVSVLLVGTSELARQAVRYSATWPTEASVSALTFRVGVLSVIGLLAGLMVRNLQRERVEVEIRAAQLAALAEEMEHQALHDMVTGLPNRVLFQHRVGAAIAAAAEDGTRVAVMLMDLDRFKEVNDTLGHHIGDLLLQQVAARGCGSTSDSRRACPPGWRRVRGLPAADGNENVATSVAERIEAAPAEPFRIDGISVEVAASIGIAMYPEHGETADQLLQRADVAMYEAKRIPDRCRALFGKEGRLPAEPPHLDG